MHSGSDRLALVCLMALGVPALASSPANADQQVEEIVDEAEDFEELDLENLFDVFYAASKHQESIFWSPSAVTVFTREDIQNSGAQNLHDILRRVPGFDVYELKAAFPLVGARALTDDSNNLVLVLVDGREALVELTGFPFWSAMTFDLEEIERVEVVRGPGSALYGANAFAGVVSITTVASRPDTRADVVLTGGECGQQRLFGRYRDQTRLGRAHLSYGAGVGRQQLRSPSDPGDDMMMDIFRVHGYLEYNLDQLKLSLHGGVVGGDGLVFIQIGDLRIKGALNYWSMGQAAFSLGEMLRVKTQLYYTRFKADLAVRNTIGAYGIWIADFPRLSWDSQAMDAQLQVDLQIDEDFLVIGGGYLHTAWVDSTGLVIDGESEVRGAWFAQLKWRPLEFLQVTAGLRHDFNDFSEPALSPRGVVIFRPWPEHAFRLGYGQAFRKPSFYESRVHLEIDEFNPATPEVVARSAEQIGNGQLVNEKVHTFEAGWQSQLLGGRLRLSLDFFLSLYQDTIFFVIDIEERMGLPYLPDSVFQFQNQNDTIRALGGEASAYLQPHEDWTVWCSAGLREVVNQDTGEGLASEPTFRLNLGGRYLPAAGWVADLAWHYVSEYRVLALNPAAIFDTPGEASLGDRMLLIGKLAYRIYSGETRRLEAGLTIRTPLGASFREYAGVPKPVILQSDRVSDFGGELYVRQASFYIRGSF